MSTSSSLPPDFLETALADALPVDAGFTLFDISLVAAPVGIRTGLVQLEPLPGPSAALFYLDLVH